MNALPYSQFFNHLLTSKENTFYINKEGKFCRFADVNVGDYFFIGWIRYEKGQANPYKLSISRNFKDGETSHSHALFADPMLSVKFGEPIKRKSDKALEKAITQLQDSFFADGNLQQRFFNFFATLL